MGKVLVGTASWTDKSLIASGRFYPRGCSSAEARLKYYASQFPMVEVDSSYYAMPSDRNSQLWVERTPSDFIFNIKAFRLFTGHQTPAASLPKDIQAALAGYFTQHRVIYYKDTPQEIRDTLWERFEAALRPLRDAGKLAAVHFQFPPWVRPHRRSYDHILECAARLPCYQLATEFRLSTWFDEEHRDGTLKFERDNGFAHVVLDMPQGFTNSVPQIWEVTSPELAIVRFHSRNAATWNVKGQVAASDRFNYDYADYELAEAVAPIHGLTDGVNLVQAIFNNNFQDQGQRNAATLRLMLSGAEAGRNAHAAREFGS